jgi:hypothetical protein
MNEVQNMDEPHRNLLKIWVFDKGKSTRFPRERQKKLRYQGRRLQPARHYEVQPPWLVAVCSA